MRNRSASFIKYVTRKMRDREESCQTYMEAHEKCLLSAYKNDLEKGKLRLNSIYGLRSFGHLLVQLSHQTDTSIERLAFADSLV